MFVSHLTPSEAQTAIPTVLSAPTTTVPEWKRTNLFPSTAAWVYFPELKTKLQILTPDLLLCEMYTERMCTEHTASAAWSRYQLLFKAVGEYGGCQFAQQTLSSQVNEKHRVPGGRRSAAATSKQSLTTQQYCSRKCLNSVRKVAGRSSEAVFHAER